MRHSGVFERTPVPGSTASRTNNTRRTRKNIRQLQQRLKEGKYQAQPLRRVYIPKEDGKQRPISIPALEDKIVQKAVVDLLNAIYEQDFLDCSYGFRPKRGQHQAWDEVGRIICTRPIGWILEIDIRSYLDSYSQCSYG
jgi:retron-type reverse transcriptase